MDICEFEGCGEAPEFICECSNKFSKFCAQHLDVHAETGLHNISENYFSINQGKSKMISFQCKNSLKLLKTFRENAIAESKAQISQIIESTQKSCARFRDLEETYTLVLEYLQRFDKIVKKQYPSPAEKFIVKYLNTPNAIYTDLLENKGEPPELELQPDYTSGFMCFFEDKTKNFNIIDPLSSKDMQFTLEISDELSIRGAFCELPNNKFFCYGGYNAGYTDVAYIIDIKNRTGEKRKSSIKKYSMGVCVHHQGEIYVIGGVHQGNKTSSERYTISSDSWAEISNTPAKTQDNCCVLVENNIFIAGGGPCCIFQYSIPNDTYSSFGEFMSGYKVILKGAKNLYLLDSGNLYESTNSSFTTFSILNSVTGIPNKKLISYPVRKDSAIYFLLDDNRIYKFELVSKQISTLRLLAF